MNSDKLRNAVLAVSSSSMKRCAKPLKTVHVAQKQSLPFVYPDFFIHCEPLFSGI